MATPSKSGSSSEESLHFDESDSESPAREWSPFDPDKLRRQLAEQRQREAQDQAQEQQFHTPTNRSPSYYGDDESSDDSFLLGEDSVDEQQQVAEINDNNEVAVQEEPREVVQHAPRPYANQLDFAAVRLAPVMAELPPPQQQQPDGQDEPSVDSSLEYAYEEPEEVHPFLRTYRAEDEEGGEEELGFRMVLCNHDNFIPNPALTPRGKAQDAKRLLYIQAREATAAWNETFEDLEWTPRSAPKISFSDKPPGVYNYGPYDKHEEDKVKPMSAFMACFYPFFALVRCCSKPKVDDEDFDEPFVNYDPSNDDDDDEDDDGFKFYDSD